MSKNEDFSISVKSLLKVSPLEIYEKLNGSVRIKFDDGITRTLPKKQLYISRYYWDLASMLNRPIKSTYVISDFYVNGYFSNKTHINLLHKINLDIINEYVCFQDDKFSIMEQVYLKIYEILEKVYHEMVTIIKPYMLSIDIIDLLEIQLEEKLLDAIKEVESYRNTESIMKVYNVLDNIIRNEPRLRNNPVVKAYLSGAINNNQVKQVLGVRGFTTDTDGKIFPYPIASSFTLGMQNMYDLVTESRSAVKALFLSTTAIQESEFFARELQQVTMSLTHLFIDDDCGTQDYTDWYVEYNENTKKSDLDVLQGTYYLNDNNVLEMITSKHTDLIGKIIKVRFPTNCRHKDKHGICGKCLGGISYSIPRTANIGHLTTVLVTEILSQSILSTKHLTASASTEVLELDNVSKRFFSIKSKNIYTFNNVVLPKNKKLFMKINQGFLFGLKDLTLSNIFKIEPSKISKIDFMEMFIEDTETLKREYFRIDIRRGNRLGVLDQKLLSYIVSNGCYSLNEKGEYEIDLSGYKPNSPFLVLPEVEYSFLALVNEVKNLFKGIDAKDNASIILTKFHNLINSRVSVNVAVLATVVRAFMVKDFANKNYDLVGDSGSDNVAPLDKIIRGRSLSNALSWGWLKSTLVNPQSFDGTNRPNSLFDVLYKPNEAVYWSERRNK